LLLLLCVAAPARAYVTNAMFKCDSDKFTLMRAGQGFRLVGLVSTLGPGYTYTIEPVQGSGDGNGVTTLTLAPSSPYVPRRGIDKLRIDRAFMSDAWPVINLRIYINDPNGLAPSTVNCIELGGVE
jgi:hypothetical protein